MKSTRTLALVVCLMLPLHLSAGPAPATVTDPDDDAVASENDDPDPDLISASVTSNGTDLHLSVRFKPGTFDQTLTGAAFALDTDQDPATGTPGTTSGCETDAEELGVDFQLEMGADLGLGALLLGFSGCNTISSNVMVPGAVAFAADGMDAVVPLAMLGGDDGLLNFKVVMFEQVGGGFNTGILDTMPDTGLPAGTSALDGGPPAGVPMVTGVFNAATSVPEGEPGHAVAPGSAVAVFGEGFASHLASPSTVPLSSQQIPLDVTLGDLTATVDGIAMPLFGVFRGEDSGVGFDQFNGQLPWEVLATPEKTAATLVITSNGVSSEPREIWVAPASPGIYSLEFGPGPGIVTNFIPDDPARLEYAQSPGTFCASFNLSPDLCGSVPQPTGTVTDPDDDAQPSVNDDPDPDVVAASATSDGTDLHLSLRFKAGTFDQALTQAVFSLDTDQDPSTGSPGTTFNCAPDCDDIGTDFLVDLGGDLGTEAEAFRFDTAGGAFLLEGAGTVTFVADGMDAVVPLALLGGDDGRLNFKVTIFEQISGMVGTTTGS